MRDSAKAVAWVAGGVLLLILLFTSYSGGHMMGGAGFADAPGGMMDGSGGFTTLWAAWMIVPALFWAAVVGLIGWLLISLIGDSERRDSPQPPDNTQDAAEIAARRLASGEIDVEEYEQIISAMQASAPEPASPGQRHTG